MDERNRTDEPSPSFTLPTNLPFNESCLPNVASPLLAQSFRWHIINIYLCSVSTTSLIDTCSLIVVSYACSDDHICITHNTSMSV
jgi:hypothetical protein